VFDLGDMEQTDQGYAKELTASQIEKQREVMKQHCIESDVVITAAQVFGRKAPVIVTRDILDNMKSGSVVVDLAVDAGGNVDGSLPDQEVDMNGVIVMGLSHGARHVSFHATQMLSSNIRNLLMEFWDGESDSFLLDSPHSSILNESFVSQPEGV
jgi:NAD(P) transhydrogenase subunit alpha